jgi:hypothetical protein
MKTAAQVLDDAFSVVKGKNGKVDYKGIAKLEENKMEIAELIIQLIQDNVTVTDPTPIFVDQVQGNISDDYAWQEVRADLRVVARSYGTKPLSQRFTWKEFMMQTSHKEINCVISLEELASGRTSPAQIAALMADAINRRRIGMILDAIDAGVPTATADHTGVTGYNLRYVGLTEANLDKAIDGLYDEGDAPAIYGRWIYLRDIRAFTNWDTQASNELLREFETRGMVGTYKGAPVVKLADQFSRTTQSHVISPDKVWISGGRKGAIFMTKDVSFLDYVVIDPRSSTFEVGTRLEDGVMVWDPYCYRMITRS